MTAHGLPRIQNAKLFLRLPLAWKISHFVVGTAIAVGKSLDPLRRILSRLRRWRPGAYDPGETKAGLELDVPTPLTGNKTSA
jgi:hypothetical protein